MAREAATIRFLELVLLKRVAPRLVSLLLQPVPRDKCWLICNRIIEYFTLLILFLTKFTPFLRDVERGGRGEEEEGIPCSFKTIQNFVICLFEREILLKFGNEDILFFFTFLSLEVEVPRCEVFRVNEIDG